MTEFEKNQRNRVKRGFNRARYDKQTVFDILDSHFLCHIGFQVEGQPHVIPTSYWREGETLYWHGSAKSHMVRSVTSGSGASVCVTHLDGLVLARSAFHTSANYRSVVCYGTPRLITDTSEIDRQLELFVERLAPGRWSQLRPMSGQERKATSVVEMSIEDAVAKVRSGGPSEDEEDLSWPVWAGHVPIGMHQLAPIDDEVAAPPALNHPLMPGYDWNTRNELENA